MLANVARIRSTRDRLDAALVSLGFHVVPSQANFLWTTHPSGEHNRLYDALRIRKILVRYMAFPEVPWANSQTLDGLRITIGTDEEIDTLIAALREIV